MKPIHWLTCLALAASPAAAQEWPQLGANAERWNYSPQRVEPPYKIRWSLRLTDIHPKHRTYCSAQIVVGDGKAYLGDKSGRLWAFDASTGTVAWTWQAGGEILHSAAYASKTVFVASMDGIVSALDSGTGARKWEYRSGRRYGYASAVLLDGTRVIVVDSGGRLAALNPATGQALWTYDCGAPVAMSPAASKGRIVVAGEDLRVHSVDAATGTRAWLAGPVPGRGFNDSYPVITRGRVFLRPRTGIEVQLVEGNSSPVPGVVVLDEASGASLPAPEHYHMAGWCGPVAPPAVTADGNLVHATRLLPGNWLISGFALVDSVNYTVFDRLIGPKSNGYDTGIGAPDEAQVASVHGDMAFQLNNQGVYWGNPPNEQNGAWDPVTRKWHISGSGLPHAPRVGEGDIGNIQQGGSNGVSGAGGLLYHHTWDVVMCWESATSTSNRPPSVTLTAPVAGASFAAPASIRLEAAASDPDGTVSRVDFLADGLVIGSASTAPWAVTWTGVAPGTYTLSAQARDNAGGIATSTTVTLSVTGASNRPPTVSLTAPADGAGFTLPADVAMQANAADPDGTLSRVDFLVNGSIVATDASAPFAATWTAATAGTYTLQARATDDAGASTTSSAITVTVGSPANPPPTVSITSPADGSTFTALATITITAAPADPDGSIARVEFLVHGAVVATRTSAPWTHAWTGVPAGAYTLTARAVDDRGGSATSTPVRITVTTPPPPPPVPSVTGFTLIDAFADVPLGPLRDGDVIDLSALVSRSLNVRADLGPAPATSVRFELDAVPDTRIETEAPHALAGRTGTDYHAWTPSVGTHVLAAVPYDGATMGTRFVITFTVIDTSPGPAPAGPASRDGENGDAAINDRCSGTVCIDPAASLVFGTLLLALMVLVR